MDDTHYIFSGKWTHVKDAWLTFWRPNHAGYCWYKTWMGTYPAPFRKDAVQDRAHGQIHLQIVDVSKLFVKVEFEGEIREVILNTVENRKALGLHKHELKASSRTILGDWKLIDQPVKNNRHAKTTRSH